jgi:hypothetical protein
MRKLILIFIILIPVFGFNQNQGKDTTVYKVVEKMPEFPGGETKLYEYLGKNIKYPKSDYSERVKSKFYFEFIIEKDGSMSNIQELRKENNSFVSSSLKVIQNMPKWTPGEHKGKKVRVKYILPIIICLR